MVIIGVTGGIGSGKSLVCDILREEYNADIINTDDIAKDQMKIGGNSYKSVIAHFGEDILLEDKNISRSKLSAIVFTNKDKLNLLNKITHPNVIACVKKRISNSKARIVVIETALAIESGLDLLCDYVWFVNASESIRKERLLKTRDISEEKIENILKSQAKSDEFKNKGYIILDNSSTIDKLKKEIERLIIEDEVM